MTPQQGRRALYGAAALAALAALVGTCSGPARNVTAPARAAAPVETALAIAEAAPVTPAATPVAAVSARPVAKPKVAVAAVPKPVKKKLRADVATKDFVVSNVSVSERGYKATIDGFVRMTRKGALAQPLLSFDLTDGSGNVIHRGSFTPMDTSGPAWLGYDELGLKRVPFSTTIDLRAEGGVLPSVPPRPYSASVRVAEVIDAKPATR
jgi:hypothetical protein